MKKIVIQVHMQSDKCRSKALKIAAIVQGVHSVSLGGESRDQVVVTGDGIDSVCLTNKLRKKFSYATLLSVTDANASNGGDDEGEQKEETNSMENMGVGYYYANYPPPPFPSYVVDYDSHPNTCSIL
ncbi:disease resistance protein Pik-1-like [Cajanus cajan]|uniref:disease resistance protein Pik-1-like n=1 Tax=Cajanus cajan TaxID=3821 RepID=UPI0010FBABD5|nr:disease resistance protein Pik-1-like [Cajanus cajan]